VKEPPFTLIPVKKILIVLFALCLGTHLWAETGSGTITLTGRITEKGTGEPIPGAQIWFPDIRKGTTSGPDGSYTVGDLPTVKLLMRVSMIGYASATFTVDLATSEVKDVVLEPSVTEMNDVVVTGASKATELKRYPVPTTLVDHQYLLEHASTNIIASLARVPGVSAVSTGPNISKPYIRGLGSSRVLTLLDGVRLEGQQWGEEHGVEVDEFVVDRIEVVKGPASLMYGSDAIAGVVNLLPAQGAELGTLDGSLLTNYQTNNNGAAASLKIDGNAKGVIHGACLSTKMASNYRNRFDGRVYGTKYRENDVHLYVGVNRSWGYSHVSFGLYDNQQEVPDGSRDSTSRRFTQQIGELDMLRPVVSDAVLSSYDIAVIHQGVQHYRLNSNSSFIVGTGRLTTSIGFQRSIRREYSHPQAPDVPGLHLELNTLSYDVKYHFPERNGWETTTGINGMLQRNNAAKGTEFVIPSYRDLDVGPFLHAKLRTGRADMSGGLRYDVRNYVSEHMTIRRDPLTGFNTSHAIQGDPVETFEAVAQVFGGLRGSLGMAYNFNERLTLKANIGRGYRAPNAAELSASGVHPGSGFAQLGSIDLRPEFNLQEDAGLFYNGTHVTASVELFNNNISDYIYNEKLVSVNGGDSLFDQAGEPYPVFKFRQTRARLFGGEFSLDIHPHPLDWMHFENAISFIQAENRGGSGAAITDSTRYLPLIPPLHTTSELRAALRKRVGPFAHVFVSLGMQYYAAQNRFFGAYGTETGTASYTLFDAGMGTDLVNKVGATRCTITILGNNLADLGYQSNMNRLKYFEDFPVNGTGRSGIYEMGRNISFKVVFPFHLQKSKDPA
jgi:iron complex outermembrane receptor protein